MDAHNFSRQATLGAQRRCGEVYFWETENVIGRDKRTKFHVFICPQDQDEAHTFLFINTAEWYRDYKILKQNYNFLSHDSVVCCNKPVFYTTERLTRAKPKLAGQLSQADLKGVRDAIIAAGTMPYRYQVRVCTALAALLCSPVAA